MQYSVRNAFHPVFQKFHSNFTQCNAPNQDWHRYTDSQAFFLAKASPRNDLPESV